jgi:hypothetical protein
MRIKAIKVEHGKWGVIPQSGRFEGLCIAHADGLSMKAIEFEGLSIYGDVSAVWGMEVLDDRVFDDPATVRGLGVGRAFDMRDQQGIKECGTEYVMPDTEARVLGAKTLWVLGREVRIFGERLGQTAPVQFLSLTQ